LGQVISQTNLILQRQNWKGNGQCVVFVSGCFDLLHPGHIRLLEQARSYGDILIVGVQSDTSARAANSAAGSNRSSSSAAPKPFGPITPAGERAEILAALAAVDYAVEFDDPSPGALIARLCPEIVVQGASQASGAGDALEGRATGAAGAKIVLIQLEPGFSTSQLVKRIIEPRA
jgi:rfaE bifunctional protein nucleotidyltransferase chain/domain